jgi:hypothetical protein
MGRNKKEANAQGCWHDKIANKACSHGAHVLPYLNKPHVLEV